jgi:hypothetical protein
MHWFGRDFKLQVDSIPLSLTMERMSRGIPHFDAITIDEENLQGSFSADIEMRKAFKNSTFRRVMDSDDGSYHLIMELDSLQITDHPLITEEFKIAKSLESLLELWESRKKSKIIDFLTNKLKVSFKKD